MNVEITLAVKIFRIIGRHVTIIGMSMIVSYFVSHYLKDNWIQFYSSIQKTELFTIFWMLFGLFIFVSGLLFIEAFSNEEKIRKFMESNSWKAFFKSLPYSLLCTVVAIYISNPLFEENPTWISEQFYRIIILNTLAIYIIFSICIKLILTLFKIFKNSIPDSKDRFSIVVTIFATIISAIALFK